MRLALPALGVLALAYSASAAITTSYAPIDSSGSQGGLAEGVVYSSIAGPYAAFAANNFLGAANYTSIMTYDAEQVTSFRFVGGVVTANTALRFNFYDASEALVDSTEVTFGQAGNFIWSITVDGSDTLIASRTGWMEIVGVNGATGKWFLGTTAPTVGSQAFVTGAYMHRFELTTSAVPAPGALALLGLAGMMRGRRR